MNSANRPSRQSSVSLCYFTLERFDPKAPLARRTQVRRTFAMLSRKLGALHVQVPKKRSISASVFPGLPRLLGYIMHQDVGLLLLIIFQLFHSASLIRHSLQMRTFTLLTMLASITIAYAYPRGLKNRQDLPSPMLCEYSQQH